MSQKRIALITGSARGIGQAIAKRLTADDFCVVIADIDESAARETAEQLASGDPTRAFALQVDVSEPASVQAMVAQVLARSGVRLAPDAGLVSYAHSCWFRGNYVPHLVFQTHAGPVTVMVLTDEHVARPVGFDEEGYGGVIVPADRGALAILSRGGQPDPGITARLRSAISHGAR